VLITPDNKVSGAKKKISSCAFVANVVVLLTHWQDYFYICPVHLKDRGFCSPIVDEAEVAAKKKKEEMDHEIEKVKQEYEEKMRKKKEKSKDKKKGDKKSENKDDDDNTKNAEKERDDKACAL
jgi:hypothetical protein